MGVLLAVIVFSVLVIIHEFGHFLLAKKNGIGVTEFSLGFGPRILSFKFHGTRYSWKLIPFGGSCAMVGNNIFEETLDDDSDEDDDSFDITDEDSESFNDKSVWARISVVLAGPMFNFLLALILAIVYISLEGYDKAEVTYVAEGYAAGQAGIEKGDEIIEYDGSDIVIFRDLWLHEYVNPLSDKAVDITVLRDGKKINKTINPTERYSLGIMYAADKTEAKVDIVSDSPVSKAGLKSEDIIININGTEINSGEELNKFFNKNPLTGDEVNVTVKRDEKEYEFKVVPEKAGYTLGWDVGIQKKVGPLKVLRYSFTELRYDAQSVFMGLKMIFTGKGTKDSVSGPVGIAKIVGDSYEATKDYGAYYVFLQIIYLMTIFSVNLGIVNLLPIPAVDGGRLLFLIIEAIRKKPVNQKVEAYVNLAFAIILFGLMILVMINDISKFF
ncbi:regulator of sigma E protease [Lachnospiraceae bacterium RM5]|nr:regulator of sigma E protease [Lachnospiraceae bacterium RM5]